MAVDFKALLGEKYTDEIASVLDGVADKLLVNDGSYIPKVRFDEVNKNLKESKSELEKIRVSQMTEEEKHKAELEALETAKRDYQIKSNKLEVEKVFKDAGMTGYDKYLDRIVSDDLEQSVAIAKEIATDFTETLKTKDAEIEKLKLQTTPQPKQGGGSEFKKLTYSEQAQLKAKDPQAYEAYVAQEDSQTQS